MAKTFIVLLFAALFVFSNAAHSLRRPETVQFSEEFSDDFFAGFGGGGGRPSFGGGRPSMGSMPRPPMNIRPPVSMPRPPMNIRPPVNIPRPPVNIPRPPVNVPRPPVNIPRPPVNIPRPPVNIPKPPVNIPKPPVNIPKPPVNIPKPPVNIPKPPVNIPKPPVNVPKPPVNIPKPPVNTPKPTPPVVNTPKPTPPVANTPKPTTPSTQIKTSVNVNNGQISGQAGITKTSGPTTVAGKVTYDQGKVGAQGTITQKIQNGQLEAGAKLGNGAKPEAHIAGSKTIGSTTVAGKAGLADGKLGAQGTITKNIQGGQIEGGAKLGYGAKPEVHVSGHKTIGDTTVAGKAGLADGRLGAQGTITKNIQGGQLEAGAKLGYGAKPEAYLGATKTVGPDSVTGRVGVTDGKLTATGGLSRNTDLGKASLDLTVGNGKPQVNLGLTNELRGGGQSSLNLNVKEGSVGGSLGFKTPLGNTGGTLSTEAGYSQEQGGFGKITATIPF